MPAETAVLHAVDMATNQRDTRPIVGDCVMVRVKRIVSLAIIVDILKYDTEGIILFSELLPRERKNISTKLPVGGRFVAKIIWDGPMCSLSKRQVTSVENDTIELEYSSI